VEEIKTFLSETTIEPSEINEYFESIESAAIPHRIKASHLLLRPNVALSKMMETVPTIQEKLEGLDNLSIEQAEIQLKYDVYIEKEKELVNRMSQLENLRIPETFNYEKVVALSNEALQKFKKIKPITLGQASRISGVNPSDIQILMVYMGR
jgi:tRNA uridine 5-carboxymethylaminomethyl modification enzyme